MYYDISDEEDADCDEEGFNDHITASNSHTNSHSNSNGSNHTSSHRTYHDTDSSKGSKHVLSNTK